jgi:type IV secretion system protein VirB2
MLHNFKSNIDLNKISLRIFIVFLLSAFAAILPLEAMADVGTDTDAISQVLCAIVTKLTGPMGRGISTIAIVVLGIGLFLGKLSWPVAIATAIGIGLIFGAAQIVVWLGTATATTGVTVGTTCLGS